MKLAIIPARGGSKRIPRKNIREFCCRPILAYSVQAALESGIFHRVMVSTDDGEIAEIARAWGAQAPFLRSPENADDTATTADVVLEVLERLAVQGEAYEEFCCLYATAPFITADKLRQGMDLLTPQADFVLPVVRYSYNPYRSVSLQDGYVRMNYPEFLETRSQDLAPVYHDCGQFYCARTAAFLREKTLFGERTVPLLIPESEVQDLDTPEDWRMAELKYRFLLEEGRLER